MQQLAKTDFARINTRRGFAKALRERALIPKRRTMRDFAESEVVIPDGDFEGQKFRAHRQPAHALFFDAVDSGHWNRFASVAPQQSGKSLAFFIIPILYHLFECRQNVVVGLPTMDIAKDKWAIDIKPAILSSRYRDQLPRRGAGSQGGTPELIQFSGGAALKFMSGGGGDEKRSAFTAPVVCVTEADKLDENAESSDEAVKLKQIEGRTRFYGKRKRVYLECTVSIETGAIWREWDKGTAGVVHVPCEHCGEFVSPERGDFVGWQDAADEWDAEHNSRFYCPSCGELWEESSRRQQLRKSVLVHRGQAVNSDGVVSGDPPRTRTLGFRYSAATNAFADVGQIGIDEWKAERAVDPHDADTEMRQWTWAIPAKPLYALEPLKVQQIISRQSRSRHGRIREDCDGLFAGADVRNSEIHWCVLASYGTAAEFIDYGIEKVGATDDAELHEFITAAVSRVCERTEKGWLVEDSDEKRGVHLGLIDVRYLPDVVRAGIADWPAWNAAMGFEAGKLDKPKKGTLHGDGYREANPDTGLTIESDADRCKERLMRQLRVERDSATAITLYAADEPDHHVPFARALTSEDTEIVVVNERERVHFFGGKGRNHWFDAAYNALLARQVYRDRIEREPEPVEYVDMDDYYG